MEVMNIIIGLLAGVLALYSATEAIDPNSTHTRRQIYVVCCMLNAAAAAGILTGGLA
jgi:hypothetical protein